MYSEAFNSQRCYKQQWHIDYYDCKKGIKSLKNIPNFCKLFIPLSCDINDINGATQVVKGSRENLPDIIKKGYISNRFPDELIESYYDSNKIVSVETKFGEVFLARTDGIHRGDL